MTTSSCTTRDSDMTHVSALQGDAWAVWNASYHAEEREPFHTLSLALYQQDIHLRVESLFARSDKQNALLDSLLETDKAA